MGDSYTSDIFHIVLLSTWCKGEGRMALLFFEGGSSGDVTLETTFFLGRRLQVFLSVRNQMD
jgi:hypothetical protein